MANQQAGRFPDFRILAAYLGLPTGNIPAVAAGKMLPGYSGGTVQDFHLIPFYPYIKGTCFLVY